MADPAREQLPDGTYAPVVVPSTSSLLAASGNATGPGRVTLPDGRYADVVSLYSAGGSGIDADTLDGQDGGYYLDRANHTGVQAISTITSLQTSLDAKQATSEKGQANGYASLGADGKVPAGQLSVSGLTYKGDYNGATNTPALANGVGATGDTYKVSVAGTPDWGAGPTQVNVGDHVVYDGTNWDVFGASEAVASVNAKTGIVVIDKTDVGLANVDNTSDAAKPISTATQTALDAKFTTPAPLIPKVVFGTTLSTNVPGLVAYDDDVAADSLAMRRFSGAIAGATAAQVDELVTLAQLNAAIAGIGAQSDLGTPQAHNSTDVFLTASSPTVQLISTASGDVLVHLPAAADVSAGKRYIIKRTTVTGSGLDVVVDENNGPLIDGTSSIGMSAQYSFRELVFDGTNWQIIGNNGA